MLIDFPDKFRKSTYVSLWSNFEYNLHKLCLVYEYRLKLQKSINDKSNLKREPRGIDKSKWYLENIVELSFTTITNWQNIKTLQKVRNCITHGNSKIGNLGLSNNKKGKRNNLIKACKIFEGF